jgi:hypothetical protein
LLPYSPRQPRGSPSSTYSFSSSILLKKSSSTPAGIKAEKRKIEEGNFFHKKLKLLEKKHQDLVKHISKASRANNTHKQQAFINQVESNYLIMLQDLNKCPNEES